MTAIRPPSILFRGERWAAARLTAIAGGWRRSLADRVAVGPRPVAVVLENHPLSVALLFALSSCSAPIVLLGPDPAGWQTSPPIPPGTPLVLPPGGERLVAAAERLGLGTVVLDDARETADAGDATRFMAAPGFVGFSSGSTGRPRPIYRTAANVLAEAAAIAGALGLVPGDGVVGALPLFRISGLKQSLLVAALLDSTLALVERFEPRPVLKLFESGEYRFCPATPLIADVLGRCPLGRPVRAPELVTVATGGLPLRGWQTFRERFAVPLRGMYGTTESGEISVDVAPASAVREGTVGTPLPGVGVAVGQTPADPRRPGEVDRVWVRSPWYMNGGGFPPDVELPDDAYDGWRPTYDLGRLDPDGVLTIVGRADDRIRTRGGHVVDPAEVAAVLREYPGVIDVAVVPLATESGAAFGAVVECEGRVSAGELRRHASGRLPSWAQPRVVRVIDALPRLAGGKIDRRQCIAIVER